MSEQEDYYSMDTNQLDGTETGSSFVVDTANQSENALHPSAFKSESFYASPSVAFNRSPEGSLTPESFTQKMIDFERDLILQHLIACGWERQKAAETIGINRTTLYNKMTVLGLFDVEKNLPVLQAPSVLSTEDVVEAENIMSCLRMHNWRRMHAARALGYSTTTLRNKMKKYDIPYNQPIAENENE